MKKVCFIDYDMSVRGGVEQVTLNLCNALAGSFDVHLISLCQKGQLEYVLDPRIHYTALQKEDLRLRQMQKQLYPKLRDYFRRNKIDTAVIQGTYAGFITAPCRFSTKTKLIFSDHGALMNQWNEKDIRLIRFLASSLCHKTVTLTNQSLKDYRRKFHTSRRKLQCIYNWIDLDIPRSDRYLSESKRIITAGRFGKEKGFDMLVKAFTMVARKHPDWCLDLYGDGEMMPEVKKLIEENNLQDQVHLMGMRSDLAEQYRKYSMYVLPSYREGMPLVLLEAKANRLPIISFDIMTGPREIVRDGVDGILVEPYNLEKFGKAMCKLIEDTALREEMSNHSQENLDDFSKKIILNQWKNMINAV